MRLDPHCAQLLAHLHHIAILGMHVHQGMLIVVVRCDRHHHILFQVIQVGECEEWPLQHHHQCRVLQEYERAVVFRIGRQVNDKEFC